MSLPNLDNLVKTGQLKVEPVNQLEFYGLLRSGEARLHDAANPSLAAESQFDRAYNAAHSLVLFSPLKRPLGHHLKGPYGH